MNIQAIGFIETKGLISAIAGADAMTKAANVEIVGSKYYKVKSGIVTIIVTGDVGAVKAAVEIGSEEARRVGTLITSHSIARPDEFVMKMILPKVYEEVKEDIKKKDKEEIKVESKEDKMDVKKEDLKQEEIVIKSEMKSTDSLIEDKQKEDKQKENKEEKNKPNKEDKKISKEDKKTIKKQ